MKQNINISIDEILNSVKKMVNSKSSRMEKYLSGLEAEKTNFDGDLDLDCSINNKEVLELTEVFENIFSKEEKNYSESNSEKNLIESEKKEISEVQISDDIKAEIPHNVNQISEETVSSSSMYLKYLAEKSAKKKIDNRGGEKSMNEFLMEAVLPYTIDWLDKNLGKIVKDVVEKEVKKISEK